MDVDFAKREVNVRRNLVRGKEGTPKGGKARAVPMSGRLCRALAEHHAMEGGVGRVLRREDGSDMTTDSQRTILRRVALYAGLPAYGMHALRHCFGSRMRQGGDAPPRTRQARDHGALHPRGRRALPQRRRSANARRDLVGRSVALLGALLVALMMSWVVGE